MGKIKSFAMRITQELPFLGTFQIIAKPLGIILPVHL